MTSNRRDFLKNATQLSAGAALFFASSTSLGAVIRSKNDRIPIGLIGAGGMGRGNLNTAKEWLDVVAIADVDSRRCDLANQQLSDGKADVYKDYRKVLERNDIKVVHIATPDHWHTKPVIEAMRAGKDIYCEKPLTLTIDEGKQIRKVQKETGRIVQVGTQQRSQFNLFTKAVALVNEGRLGKIKKIQCAIGGAPASKSIPKAEVPKELDWDMWLGPAPKVDYLAGQEDVGNDKTSYRTNGHYEFRWWYEYSGGKLTDWGAHHVDIAAWAIAVNGQEVAPVSISGEARHPVPFVDGHPTENDKYNTATKFNFSVKLKGGAEIVIRNDTDNGCLIEGDKGRIFVNRGKLVGAPVEQLKDEPLPEDAISKVYKGLPVEHVERKAHWSNFLHCHMNGLEPISDVHAHMEALNICHLAGLSARLGRPLNWDASSEQITGDDQANGFVARPYRSGFEIEG